MSAGTVRVVGSWVCGMLLIACQSEWPREVPLCGAKPYPCPYMDTDRFCEGWDRVELSLRRNRRGLSWATRTLRVPPPRPRPGRTTTVSGPSRRAHLRPDGAPRAAGE